MMFLDFGESGRIAPNRFYQGTAFQRSIFLFLSSTFQNSYLFASIFIVQSSMYLYDSPSNLVAKLKLIEWVHSSNMQQRRLRSVEGKPFDGCLGHSKLKATFDVSFL